MNNYMYIGNCYYSPSCVEKTLVMHGVFTGDDLYNVHIRLVEENII